MTDFHLTQQEAAGLGNPLRENRLEPGELIIGYRLALRHRGGAGVRQGPGARVLRVRDRLGRGDGAQRGRCHPGGPGCAGLGRAETVAAERHRAGTRRASLWTEMQLMPAIDRAMSAARPLPNNGFKTVLAGRAAMRALLLAGGAA